VAAVERCKRQLSALINDLRSLDRSVLSPQPGIGHSERADNLQKALDATVFHLATVANTPTSSSVVRERLLVAIDCALRDSCYEAARLLGPRQRRA